MGRLHPEDRLRHKNRRACAATLSRWFGYHGNSFRQHLDIVDEKQEQLFFGGSTVFTADQIKGMNVFKEGGTQMIRALTNQSMPLDLKGREDDWVSDLAHIYKLETRESRIRYCVPLNAAGQLIGIMTLSEKYL